MPTARGITVQIIAEVDSRVFPEFPCPLSTQSKISEAVRRSAGPMMISGSKADRVLGRDPITSVYIPSIPGTLILSDSLLMVDCLLICSAS